MPEQEFLLVRNNWLVQFEYAENFSATYHHSQLHVRPALDSINVVRRSILHVFLTSLFDEEILQRRRKKKHHEKEKHSILYDAIVLYVFLSNLNAHYKRKPCSL